MNLDQRMSTNLQTTQQASPRFSRYSAAPSLQPSIAMSTSSTVTNNTADGASSFKGEAYHTSPSARTYDTEKIAVNGPRASVSTVGTNDPRTNDIKSWKAGFQRMQDERLDKQRYTMSDKKEDEITTIALGAKVERALGRRMHAQDATFTRRESLSTRTINPEPAELPEKRSLEVSAP